MVLGFDLDRLRSGPFEGPAIVKPPALPGDTYLSSLLVPLRKGEFIKRGHPPSAMRVWLEGESWL